MAEVLRDQPTLTVPSAALAPARLSAGISAVATSMMLDSIPPYFPTDGTFTVNIDNELIKVTAVASVFTLLRAQGTPATTAAAHALGAGVWLVMDKRAIDAYIAENGVSDHGALTGLGDDDHTIYALLAGRAGGQTIKGGTASGEHLTLSSTNHATKGKLYLGSAQTSWFDETTSILLTFEHHTPITGTYYFTSSDRARGMFVTSGGGGQASIYSGNSSLTAIAAGNIAITPASGIVQQGADSATPVNQVFQGPSGVGSNIVGGTVRAAPGKSTGNALPASYIIQSTVAGSSGSSAQTLSDTLTVTNGGVAVTGTADISTSVKTPLVFSGNGSTTGMYIADAGGNLFVFGRADLTSIRFGVGNAEKAILKLEGFGVGLSAGTTPAARIHALSTTEQLRLGYDASNYASFTTSSAGLLTLAATGASAGFKFSSPVGFNAAAPVAQSTGWAVSNVTTDKVMDCNATSLDEIADVLATLITYLISRGDLAA